MTMEKGGGEGLRARPLPIVPSLYRFGCVEGILSDESLDCAEGGWGGTSEPRPGPYVVVFLLLSTM